MNQSYWLEIQGKFVVVIVFTIDDNLYFQLWENNSLSVLGLSVAEEVVPDQLPHAYRSC